MTIVQIAPFLVVGLYTLFLLFMVFNANFRKNLEDAHKESKYSTYSWTRYASSFLILSAVVIIFAQILGNKEINFTLVSMMITIAMGGKLVHSKNADGSSIFSLNRGKKKVSESVVKTDTNEVNNDNVIETEVINNEEEIIKEDEK